MWEVLITICERIQDRSLTMWMRIDKSEHQQSTSGQEEATITTSKMKTKWEETTMNESYQNTNGQEEIVLIISKMWMNEIEQYWTQAKCKDF
jgi:hypothetical protein